MKSCFFIGHREASEEIFPELAEAVERHIVDYSVRFPLLQVDPVNPYGFCPLDDI